MTSRHLPMLKQRVGALETCGYCPKLCRGACPVALAEPREALTPWGKMTMSWLLQRGELPLDRANARLAWACSDCHAYRERCDHDNPTDETLVAARSDFVAAGVAPEAALAVIRSGEQRRRSVTEGLAKLGLPTETDPRPAAALLIGCDYVRHLPEVAAAAVRVVRQLVRSVRVIDGCCGAPELYAGDRAGFEAKLAEVKAACEGAERVIVADAGCGRLLSEVSAVSVVELAAAQPDRLGRGRCRAAGPVRWHDPCQLGRGRGVFEPPRRVLERVLDAAPGEFEQCQRIAACSGGGGLMPVTYPELSSQMADRRLQEHERLGGGTVVTACGASLRRFRSRGARAVDIVSLIDQSL